MAIGWINCSAGTAYPSNYQKIAPYYAYLPTGSSGSVPRPGRYPVLLFLHGAGEQAAAGNPCTTAPATHHSQVATNLLKLETNAGGPTTAIRDGRFNPPEAMVVLAIQSQNWGNFPVDNIDSVIRDAAYRLNQDYGVELDGDRVYITGLSMGGGTNGVLRFAVTHPTKIAAVVPIEAAGTPDACTFKDTALPFWGFAGRASGQMFANGLGELLRAGNGSCKRGTAAYTSVYPNTGYTCTMTDSRFGSGNVSCTQLVADEPVKGRATWMPTNGHSGWKEIYNGTHSSLPPGASIYSWMLQFRNSDRGNPPYPFR